MTINIVFGFLIPWLIWILFYRREVRTVLTVAPFASVLAFIASFTGYSLDWWVLHPVYKADTFSFLTANLGLYPVSACILVEIARRTGYLLRWVLIFASVLTLLEGVGILLDKVGYGNGWNLGWTFASYVIPYALTVGFARLLIRENVLQGWRWKGVT